MSYEEDTIHSIVKRYINQLVDDAIKLEISDDTDTHISIEESKKLWLEHYLESFLDDLECPVKIAAKYFGNVDLPMLQKAFKQSDWKEYIHGAELLATDAKNEYMISKCPYCNYRPDRIDRLSLEMIANIYLTIGFTKENYLKLIQSFNLDPRFIRVDEVERIWDAAINNERGTVCQYCFHTRLTPFDEPDDTIEMEEGVKC